MPTHTQFQVPELFSQRRAAAIAGLDRRTIAKAVGTHGPFAQVAKSDLEAFLGRAVTLADWDIATLEMSHAAMARRSYTEASEAA